MIFTSDEVTNENHWQITSRVTKKSLFTVTNVLFFIYHMAPVPPAESSYCSLCKYGHQKHIAFNSLFILTLLFSQSVNGLLADGTKPLPEPIMTYNQWVLVFFIWVQFYRNASAIVTIYWNMFGNHISYVTARSPWLATRLTQFPKKIFVFWLKWH